MKLIIYIFLLIFTFSPSFAQNTDQEFVIREIYFYVEGRTQDFALMQHGEFYYGERIQGRDNLYRYIALKTQLLNNQRVLDDSYTRIDYSLDAMEEDGALPVILMVFVRDSRNFVVLPYPEYSTNSGFGLTLKARNYNFLGTMTPMSIDLGYQRNNEGNNSFNFAFNMSMPFQAGGLNWNLIFGNSIVYEPNNPLRFNTSVGLALNIPWYRTTFGFGATQFLYINEPVSTDSNTHYGVNRSHYSPYFGTELFGFWRIPLGLEIGEYGMLNYTFRLAFRVNYPTIPTDLTLKPTTINTHTISFGRINWIGNFQSGMSFNLSLMNTFYIDNHEAPFGMAIDTRLIYHQPIANHFGLSTRLTYRQWWRHSNRTGGLVGINNAGDMLRGIPDNNLKATQMFSFSLDFAVRVLRFTPSVWFNAPGLSIFNVDVHLAPFTDIALLSGEYMNNDGTWSGVNFSPANVKQTIGLEMIIFSGHFRSLSLRASLGYDVDRLRSEGLRLMGGFFPRWHEIYIGLERSY